jgi:hypothetical protein
MRRGSSIVHISSAHALLSWPRCAAYDASKAGLLGLTRAMALDHGRQGIRVNCIAPGYIQTPLLQLAVERGDRLARRPQPPVVARRVAQRGLDGMVPPQPDRAAGRPAAAPPALHPAGPSAPRPPLPVRIVLRQPVSFPLRPAGFPGVAPASGHAGRQGLTGPVRFAMARFSRPDGSSRRSGRRAARADGVDRWPSG